VGSYTGTVPSLLAGDLLDADKTVEMTNLMTALTAAWTSAAPTWTVGAGPFGIGDGALTGRYRRIGKTVDWRLTWQAGSTTTYGTAGTNFFFTIPGGGTATGGFAGAARFVDSSAGNQRFPLVWEMDGSTTMRLFRCNNDSELLNNLPVVMATGDYIVASGTVEIS
jgi:hypothetical protein